MSRDNGNDWQPAVVLSLEAMCPFHAEIFKAMPLRIQQSRAELVGKRILVQKLNGYVSSPIDDTPLEKGRCIPLRVKDEKGHTSGIFSCEVSTD